MKKVNFLYILGIACYFFAHKIQGWEILFIFSLILISLGLIFQFILDPWIEKLKTEIPRGLLEDLFYKPL